MSFTFTQKDLTEWGSALLVFVSGATTGHYAATGMNAIQWMGAAAAVLGSVAVAVAVRVWPAKTGATVKAED
ncbi:hypothetical protein [uncultured Phenylobacterium sp.]|uniref:hypothetical protein n=1 Tax=uncultured Phenylobacterium sp. TaxID=349273 RepID=UPI0025D15CDE|nr:hypothetical protein [uncultured Phenylobacterium sp.]